MKIYYDTLTHNNRDYLVASTDKGLCFVGGENEKLEDLIKFFPKNELIHNNTKLEKYKIEIKNYLSNKPFNFDFEFDLYGTEFQKKVWLELLKIPYGKTTTYKKVAIAINNEKAVRAVANAVGRNPLTIIIPCHRVIGTNGTLTGYRGGIEMKRRLLKLENIKLVN